MRQKRVVLAEKDVLSGPKKVSFFAKGSAMESDWKRNWNRDIRILERINELNKWFLGISIVV